MTTLIAAACHCRANEFQIPLKTSTLPKVSSMCHCNICRHCTGSMSYADVRMDGEPLSPNATVDNLSPGDLKGLTEYRSSSVLSRYFCSTCSAHMFIRSNPQSDGTPGTWSVNWGMLEKTDGIVEFDKHIFLGDTIDGGIADHFLTYADRRLTRFKGWDNPDEAKLPVGWRANVGGSKGDTLPVHCHCKSVSLYLTRPRPSDNPEVYWIVPGKEASDPVRFMAGHCLCNSCRLCNGGQIQSWIIVPNENIFNASTKVLLNLTDPSQRPKGLKQYTSSDGRHRESCGTCGATVIWWRHMSEGESAHLDVSAGLIDQVAGGGARAEAWVAWYNIPLNDDCALSKHTAKALKEGLDAKLGGGESCTD